MLLVNLTGPFPCTDCISDSFLQSEFWGQFKTLFGWRYSFFNAQWLMSEKCAGMFLVLQKELLPGISFAYIPWGPELPESINEDLRFAALEELSIRLKPLLSKQTAFIRFDPPWFYKDAVAQGFVGKPFFHAPADIQPPDTVIISLNTAPDEILSQMKSKWRYNIRLAEKKVIVTRPDTEGIDAFYAIFQETAIRDGISVHDIDYYKKLFDLASSFRNAGKCAPEPHLYLAEHEGDIIAGIITLFWGKTATYLYGASSDRKRNLMAPYLLQWKAMQDAKLAGCCEYDLFGIPPDDNPDHPMAGLYRFKTGFGGAVLHRLGSCDYPYKRLAYMLFYAAEKSRKLFRDSKKRRRKSKITK
jgi:lipid II:glycine glycyltransferase (peptidoglycan interpeptide bridge formation enzyme)